MSGIAKETRREMLEAEVDAAGPAAKAIYVTALNTGAGIEFAAMCALKQAPGSKNTDRAFCDGARRRMNNMDPVNRNKIYQAAIKAGVNTAGKFYSGALGRYTDQNAWVSCAQDVVTYAKEKQVNVEGVVTHRAARDLPPPKPVLLAEDIARRMENQILAAEPRTREKVKKNPSARKELRERVVAQHSGSRKRRS